MNEHHNSFVINVTRYGLPGVVGIFYLTASRGFGFTADSTFQLLSSIKHGQPRFLADGFPSPLWQFFLMIGGWFHLDPLLAAKVLSLISACATILVAYLAANEILHDRLIAFCVSLVLAMQGWMLQISPSGSALVLALTLALASLFFMLRNEYVVAPFILGLTTLLAWQTVFLMIPLCLDIWVNSVSKQRSLKVALSALLVYLSALLPWLLFAWINHLHNLPTLLAISELPPPSISALVVVALLGILALVGFVFSRKSGVTGVDMLRAHGGVVMFLVVLILLASVYQSQIWLAALPVVVMYAFAGLAAVMKYAGRQGQLYGFSFVLTALLLIHLQVDYYRSNRMVMSSTIEKTNELSVAAEWIRMHSSVGQFVSADCPGLLEYYSDLPAFDLSRSAGTSADYVVTNERNVEGYELAFKPGDPTIAADAAEQHYAVWRKK